MATDMSFLATGLTPLREAFGMEFGTGNPFALPCVTSPAAAAAITVSGKKHLTGMNNSGEKRGNVPVRGETAKMAPSPPSKDSPGALVARGNKSKVGAHVIMSGF